MHRFYLTILALCFLKLVAAQFPFFGGMFGHQQQQPQQPSGSQWLAFAESISCTNYLCPETMQCVEKPVDCPCPNVEDVKCIVSDAVDKEGTVICVRGGIDCSQVEKLAGKFA